MSGYKKYVVTWTEIHQKEMLDTCKTNAETSAFIVSHNSNKTCIRRENFKAIEV